MWSEQGKGKSPSSLHKRFSTHRTPLASILSPSSSQMKKILQIWKRMVQLSSAHTPCVPSSPPFCFSLPSAQLVDTLPRQWGLLHMALRPRDADHSACCHKLRVALGCLARGCYRPFSNPLNKQCCGEVKHC